MAKSGKSQNTTTQISKQITIAAMGPTNHANISPENRAYWWVSHNQTSSQEVNGNYIWSPVTRSNGGKNEFYENMKRIRPGDVVFSFAKAKIGAIGVCTAPAILAPKPSEFGPAGDTWVNEGWRVPVGFTCLDTTFCPKNHMDVLASTLPDKYSPIRANGNGNQGAYLAAVPKEMAQVLIDLLGDQWSRLEPKIVPVLKAHQEELEESEQEVERVIRNRTDIEETEKLQLVRSRRGQGVYRQNLQSMETGCRITGVTNRRHLVASHIKPWRMSNNFEKLDGNNGLLLSPHVDHLFDQGYISFKNDGWLLVSPKADTDTLARWGIDQTKKFGAFRSEQLPYMAFHREFVFRS